MSFWAHLTQAGLAATEAAAQHQAKTTKKPRGKGKPECTPCAAQAYVDALRGTAQGR